MPQHGTIACSFVGARWLGLNEESNRTARADECSEVLKTSGASAVRSQLPGAGGGQTRGHGLSFTLEQTVR
jgi:hypothetical protein